MRDFLLTAITRDPSTARAADDAGVDRVGIDLERLGKTDRQDPGAGLRISDHELEDLALLAAHVHKAEIFVRVNSWHDGSGREIERALELGAQAIMLPYFTESRDPLRFLEAIAGRAKPILLVETLAAAERIGELSRLPGVDEIMVGLNDLQLSLGLKNQFEVFGMELMDRMAAEVRAAGVRFGFGGVARPDQMLPVPPDLVLAQYARLDATSAFLARAFYRGIRAEAIPAAVRQLRERLAFWFAQPREVLEEQRTKLAAAVRMLG